MVVVKGARGELQKNFRHMDVDIKYNKAKGIITVDKWFGKKKELAAIKTVCSHIENLFVGVQRVSSSECHTTERLSGIQVQDEARVCSFPCERWHR